MFAAGKLEWVGRARRGAAWLGGAFLDASFPAQCAGCGGVVGVSGFHAICAACAERVQWIEGPKCLTCGFPFFGDTESQAHCSHCEHLARPAFGQGWAVALFRGPVRGLIHALKYEKGFWALRDVRRMVERAPDLEAYLGDAVLVPVPLHSHRLRERGYNQSQLIAELVASVYPGCTLEPLLARVMDTTSQTRFNRKDRIRNLKNAFSLGRNRAIDPTKRYMIVDDVFTTGSTVNACAGALRKAGARRVDALTLGHG